MIPQGPPPPTIEVCPRCRVHRMHERWCYHCGFKGQGIVYAIAAQPATTPITNQVDKE